MKITYESVPEGYRIYLGERLLGIYADKHHQNGFKNGVMVWEPMPPAGRTIHWTSPIVHVDLLAAVLSSLPA